MAVNSEENVQTLRREACESRIREALLSKESPALDQLVNQYCEQFPEEAFGWVALGETCLRRSEFTAARDAFLEALACDLHNETAISRLRHIRTCHSDRVARLAVILSNKLKLPIKIGYPAVKFTIHSVLLVGLVTLIMFMKGLR